MSEVYVNPYRPGAGHEPPYLAGREKEIDEFQKLLDQPVILNNVILTGLRGVGKTVLLERFKPLAFYKKWLWVGTDLSESVSVSEEKTVLRILTDLSVVTSNVAFEAKADLKIGFSASDAPQTITHYLNYDLLVQIYHSTPGLASDKLKAVLEFVWSCLAPKGHKGIIFAYDEAQTMTDHTEKEQYPLSLLLDVFQSIQRKAIPFMLVLTGLPTLFPILVETRTFSERMFRVLFLERLNPQQSKDAIIIPTKNHTIKFNEESVNLIIKESEGYPYFIQFICRETYDVFLQKIQNSEKPSVPIEEITRKLDTDFFAGRWAKATDRQRELLYVIALLPTSNSEFTVQEVVDESKKYDIKNFSNSHVNQMLYSLSNVGLIYKNRYGKYSFAVPLLDKFIRRQANEIKLKK